MLTNSCINDIKARTEITDVISSFIKLKDNKASCPFHNEKSGSFSVSPTKQIYKCFGCGATGDAIKFIIEFNKWTFVEAIEYLAGKYNVMLEYEGKIDPGEITEKRNQMKEYQSLMQFAQGKFKEALSIDARNYLINERKFNDETIVRFELGYSPADWQYLTNSLSNLGYINNGLELGIVSQKNNKTYDTFYNRITFPLHDHNSQLIGFAGRTMDKEKGVKYINSKEQLLYSKSKVLYGLHLAKQIISMKKYAYLVEGYADVISMHQHTYENTVAKCGTALTPDQIRLMKRFCQHVIMIPDTDDAGLKAASIDIHNLIDNEFKIEIILTPEKDIDATLLSDSNFLETNIPEDAIIWLSARYWADAKDPDSIAHAIEYITALLIKISNPVKRNTYVDNITREFKIKNSALKKSVKDAIEAKKKKEDDDKAKILLEGKISNNAQAGLPDDFSGNAYDAIKYGIYEHDKQYYSRGAKGDYSISNFTMKILYHVETSDDSAFRLIAVKNVFGFETVINMNTDDFVSVSSFKKVIAKKGNYIFKGGDADLSKLQEFLQRDETKTTLVRTLGYNPRGNFYAFSNGIVSLTNQNTFLPIDQYGIINYDERNFFIPANSMMFADKDDMFTNEKKFIYMKSEHTFDTWAQNFHTVYGDKGKIAIAYYIATLFRDIVMKKMRRFPILNLYGQRGSGKGEFADSILRLFGESQDQIMLGGVSTTVGFMRKFAQYRNAIVWLDEYKNNINPKMVESIKNLYDGLGYTRGKMTNDFQTDSTPVYSACILSGQEMPTIEPALFTRVIMLGFEPGKFTEKQRANFKQLKTMEVEGISYITAELNNHRALIENNFTENFDPTYKAIVAQVNNPEIEERMLSNISILATIMYCIRDVINLPFSFNELKTVLIDNMKEQFIILQGNDDIAKWWQMVESLYHTNLCQRDRDFMIEDGYLFIRIQQVHPYYLKELRLRGDANALSKPTLENYIKMDKGSYSDYLKKRFKDGSNTWCYKIRYDKLGIDLAKPGDGTDASEEMPFPINS